MCNGIQGQVSCDLRDVEVGQEEVKQRPKREMNEGWGERI